MAFIKILHLHKYYQKEDKIAVDDFSLDIEQNERIVIVGPSGCGKTTLLHMLAGILPSDQGSIFMDGKDITTLAANKRDIAMVFQDQALFPHLSVEENIAFGLAYQGHTKEWIDQEVDQVLKDLHLEDVKGRKTCTLSGGQAKRVALARAFVRHAKIILMDEPLSSLDANLREEFRHFILTYHAKHPCTLLYVTHDQREAMSMASRIVVMKDAKIAQVDTPMNIYQHPNTMFVASFIGSYGMNFIPKDSIMVGIRPESFTMKEKKDTYSLLVRVLYRECFGDRFLYVCKYQDVILKALLSECIDTESLTLYVSKDAVLYFDSQSGKRFLHSFDMQL